MHHCRCQPDCLPVCLSTAMTGYISHSQVFSISLLLLSPPPSPSTPRPSPSSLSCSCALLLITLYSLTRGQRKRQKGITSASVDVDVWQLAALWDSPSPPPPPTPPTSPAIINYLFSLSLTSHTTHNAVLTMFYSEWIKKQDDWIAFILIWSPVIHLLSKRTFSVFLMLYQLCLFEQSQRIYLPSNHLPPRRMEN